MVQRWAINHWWGSQFSSDLQVSAGSCTDADAEACLPYIWRQTLGEAWSRWPGSDRPRSCSPKLGVLKCTTLQMSPLFSEKTLSIDRDKQGTTAYDYMRLLYHCMHSRLHAELLIVNATMAPAASEEISSRSLILYVCNICVLFYRHVEFVLSHFQKFGHSSQKKKSLAIDMLTRDFKK